MYDDFDRIYLFENILHCVLNESLSYLLMPANGNLLITCHGKFPLYIWYLYFKAKLLYIQ